MAPLKYQALAHRCDELQAVVSGIEIGLGLAAGSLKNTSQAAEALEDLMREQTLDSATVERSLALHSMVVRLSTRYGAPLANSTLFDQLMELVDTVLEQGALAPAAHSEPLED